MFKRIRGLLLMDKGTLKEIVERPTSLIYIFFLLVGILTMFMIYLIQVPSGLNSIIIFASTFSVSIIVLLFLVVMVIGACIYFFILYIVCIVGVHLRKPREAHRPKKTLFNLYIYSLAPVLILITQIPFLMIFGGHYSLFNLRPFFFALLGLVIGWHVLLLYRAIQVGSDITPKRAGILVGIYVGIIGAGAAFIIYAILYINFDISWLGALSF